MEKNIQLKYEGLLCLIRAAISGTGEQLPENSNWDEILSIAVAHGICPIIYVGAQLCGVAKDSPAMQALLKKYYALLLQSERQMAKVNKIYSAFDAAGIDYMPLKGCILKGMYPSPEMRPMGDADILIRLEQYDSVRGVMAGLGFVEGHESDHELVWKHEHLYVELHKHLIPSYNVDYYNLFGDGWEIALKTGEGRKFEMGDEDQFIYIFSHFAKHYRDGGIGIRHLIDLWIYRMHKSNMNEEYIKSKLNAVGLDRFYDNILSVIAAWFEGKKWSERDSFITDVLINSGRFGNAESHMLAAYARVGEGASATVSKRRWVVRRIFPKLAGMKRVYPILEKAPILLPLYWVIRWFRVLLFRKDSVKKHLTAFEKSSEQIDGYRDALHYVGLHFEHTGK